MAIDKKLADSVREVFTGGGVASEEKRMMGGLCFMVDGKMCVGIDGNRLMVRLDPAICEESLKLPGCVPMDFTGRRMRGFVFVNSEGTKSDRSLQYWIKLAMEYNPQARSSKTKARGGSTSANNSSTTQHKRRVSKRSSP
ncbi:MAG: TfoX/Sxy family protein [Planctomycetaceae bacterium]